MWHLKLQLYLATSRQHSRDTFCIFKDKKFNFKEIRRTSLSSYDYMFKIKINWKLIDMSPRLTLHSLPLDPIAFLGIYASFLLRKKLKQSELNVRRSLRRSRCWESNNSLLLLIKLNWNFKLLLLLPPPVWQVYLQ